MNFKDELGVHNSIKTIACHLTFAEILSPNSGIASRVAIIAVLALIVGSASM